MKKLVLAVFLPVAFTTVYAQSTFAPLGAYWNYDYTAHSGGLGSTWTIKVTHDTLINGYQTKTLTKYYDNYYALPPNTVGQGVEHFGTLRYRNDSVFFESDFLFHFNMVAGDTVFMDPFPPKRVYAVVDTFYSALIDGQLLTRWDLTKYCDTSHFPYGDTVSIVENIGFINDYLTGNIDGCYTGPGWWNFICYNSDSLHYSTSGSPCEMAYDAVNENLWEENDLNIYPVPAQNSLHVSLRKKVQHASLKVFNVNMQVMGQWDYSGLNDQSIDVSAFAPGTYFLRLEAAGIQVTRRIVLVK